MLFDVKKLLNIKRTKLTREKKVLNIYLSQRFHLGSVGSIFESISVKIIRILIKIIFLNILILSIFLCK